MRSLAGLYAVQSSNFLILLKVRIVKQHTALSGGLVFLFLNFLVDLALSRVWVVFLEFELSGDLLLILSGHTNVSRSGLHFLQAVL